jgi:hypothetical protein
MRIAKFVLVGMALLALTPAAGSAQDDRRIHVNFGGGPTFAGGDLGDKFATGWGPAVGVTFDAPRLGFQFEYANRWFDINDDLPFGATRFGANHQTHQLDFNLVANLTKPDSGLRGYVVAGPGAYNRKVEITEYVGSGVICDPYYYVFGAYPVSAVLGSRGGWDFGFNFGGGVGIPIGDSAQFYIEMRYHYVAGPDVQPVVTPLGTIAATGGSSNGYYYPLTFGFRF